MMDMMPTNKWPRLSHGHNLLPVKYAFMEIVHHFFGKYLRSRLSLCFSLRIRLGQWGCLVVPSSAFLHAVQFGRFWGWFESRVRVWLLRPDLARKGCRDDHDCGGWADWSANPVGRNGAVDESPRASLFTHALALPHCHQSILRLDDDFLCRHVDLVRDGCVDRLVSPIITFFRAVYARALVVISRAFNSTRN